MIRRTRTLLPLVAVAVLFHGSLHAQGPQPKAATPSDARPATIINLNTATVTDLQELPGIGAKTAVRIIDYRQKIGSFKKIEELMNVQGIGEKSFLRLKSLITVTPPKPEGK